MKTTELENLFNKITHSEKNNFLWDILKNDERIKKMFIEKYFQEWEAIRLQNPPDFDVNELLNKIWEDAAEISKGLNQLDFEDLDWDLWEDPGYYVPDYEAAQMIAEGMADHALEGLLDKLKNEIEFGNLTHIVSELASIVHGIDMAEIYDPYNNISDYPNDYFFEKVRNNLMEEKDKLLSRNFLPDDYKTAFGLLFKFREEKEQKEENPEDLFMTMIADLLIAVINNKENAQVFWQLANEFRIDLKEFPRLLNHVVGLMDNKKLWVQIMESIFLQDYQTSEDLMAYYFKSQKEIFQEKATAFFEKYKYESYTFLAEKVKKGSPLHISILKHAALKMERISAFRELSGFVSEDEKIQLIESISNLRYRIQLWNHEKMFDKTEAIISDELKDDPVYDRIDFTQSIKYLYNPMPESAIRLTEIKVEKVLKSERNRVAYQYIADLLKQSLSIPGKQEYIYSMVNQLYNHKPNLPALKDELRKAGLMV
ncbi:MAG: hypothetical protein K0B37_15055 [Bacteroidales bacterium]|nr:hypothetical protein [Bacteroidales bacterium]